MSILKSLLVLFAVTLSLSTIAQNAQFYADSSKLRVYAGSDEHFEEVLQMEWLIDGKTLHFGSDTIEVKPNPNKLDTIYFRKDASSIYDTLICNIAEATTYNFEYNTCCNYFNVRNVTSKQFLSGKIIYKSTHAIKGNPVIGSIGEVAIFVKQNQTDTLTPMCRSAMSPNIYSVLIKEIEECPEEETEAHGLCLYKDKGKDVSYELSFKTVSNKFEAKYIPLSDTPLTITYNPKSGKVVCL